MDTERELSDAGLLIREAAGLWHEPIAAELRLLRALEIEPESEDALIALYRFLFYRGERARALDLARQCVRRAGDELGLPADWRTADASGIDFGDPERPRHRFYLFALNAYGYLLARLGRNEEAEAALAAVRRLDPGDRIGGGRLLAVLKHGPEDDE
jgi:hypothetical protein